MMDGWMDDCGRTDRLAIRLRRGVSAAAEKSFSRPRNIYISEHILYVAQKRMGLLDGWSCLPTLSKRCRAYPDYLSYTGSYVTNK